MLLYTCYRRGEIREITDAVKRVILFSILFVGFILFIVGASTSAYSTIQGVIIFLCFLVVGEALRKWGILRRWA